MFWQLQKSNQAIQIWGIPIFTFQISFIYRHVAQNIEHFLNYFNRKELFVSNMLLFFPFFQLKESLKEKFAIYNYNQQFLGVFFLLSWLGIVIIWFWF